MGNACSDTTFVFYFSESENAKAVTTKREATLCQDVNDSNFDIIHNHEYIYRQI